MFTGGGHTVYRRNFRCEDRKVNVYDRCLQYWTPMFTVSLDSGLVFDTV